jgi:uncharacterized heparinase superfamily protein
MSAAHVASRVRQAATSRLDRAGLLYPARAPRAARAVDRFWRDGSSRFFAGPARHDVITLVTEHAPDSRAAILATADDVGRRRFDLLGYRALDFGDPPDWFLDPVSGRRAPASRHARAIDALDERAIGDHKVVWELNRHQWAVALAAAWRLTGERRHAHVFAELVSDWLAKNPRGRGVNWTSSLEVALRSVAWCWALHLFGPAAPLPRALVSDLLEALWLSARHVERYLSVTFSPNTHLTGEALGLVYAGAMLGDAPRAAHWRALGARILIAESGRQILPDGVYFERTTYYARYTADIYLHFMILAARNGIRVPPEVTARVERMLDFLLAMRRGDGTMPLLGDADGGALLPLAPRAPDDYRGLFGLAAAWLRRGDCAWAAGGTVPEALWLLGPGAARTVAALDRRPPAAPASRVFPAGGYVVMRTGWHARAHQLVLDVDPLGCPLSAGHGHAGLLGIECSVFGVPAITDAGTGTYTTARGHRGFFRSTAAHSTVRVDGVDHAEPAGPFAWRMRPRGRLVRVRGDATLDLVEAEHDAYARLPDPVRHRRTVIRARDGGFVIVDDLLGAAEHHVELQFQFTPGRLEVDPDGWISAVTAGLRVRAVSRVPLKVEVHEGSTEPMRGWVSAHYGQWSPAPMLVYAVTARLPLRIVTMLMPDPAAAALTSEVCNRVPTCKPLLTAE